MKRTISAIHILAMVISILAAIPITALEPVNFTGSWAITIAPEYINFPREHDLGVLTLTQSGATVTGTCSNYPNLTFVSSIVSDYGMTGKYEDKTQSIRGELSVGFASADINNGTGTMSAFIKDFDADGNPITDRMTAFYNQGLAEALVTFTRVGGAPIPTPTPEPTPPPVPEQPTPTPMPTPPPVQENPVQQQPVQQQPAPIGEQFVDDQPSQDFIADNTGTGFTAYPSDTSFMMNGAPVSVTQAYNINDNNYLQLRAIADMLKGTAAQFNVSWDGTYAVIETGRPYTGEPTYAAMQTTTDVRRSGTQFMVDGRLVSFDNAYLIDGDTNYLQLREVAEILSGTASQFNIWWDGARAVAVNEPGREYTGNYQSPAFSITPAAGITVSAKEFALDRERNISVTELNLDDCPDVVFGALANFSVPLKYYDFSAELSETEQLPGMLDFSIDLNTLGIEQDMWQDLVVNRVLESGDRVRMQSEISGSQLQFSTKQNTGLELAAVLAAGLYGLEKIGEGIENDKKWEGMPRETLTYQYLPEGDSIIYDEHRLKKKEIYTNIASYAVNSRYKMYWVPKKGSEWDVNMKGLIRVWGKIAAEAKLYNTTGNSLSNSCIYIARTIKSKDYGLGKELYDYAAKFADTEWVKSQMPYDVDLVYNAILKGDAYTTSKYGSRTDCIDIVCTPPSGGNNYATFSRTYLGILKPYIRVYMGNISDTPNVNTVKGGIRDIVYVNVAHEMFHACQSAYDNNSLEFNEATAMVFERQLAVAYIKDGTISQDPVWPEEANRWDLLGNYWMPKNLELVRAESTAYGYTMGRFLWYLCDTKGYRQLGNLQDVLLKYQKKRNFTAVVSECVGGYDKLCDAWLDFCLANVDKFRPVKRTTLPAGSQNMAVYFNRAPFTMNIREFVLTDTKNPITLKIHNWHEGEVYIGLAGEKYPTGISSGSITFTPTGNTLRIIEVSFCKETSKEYADPSAWASHWYYVSQEKEEEKPTPTPAPTPTPTPAPEPEKAVGECGCDAKGCVKGEYYRKYGGLPCSCGFWGHTCGWHPPSN